MYPFKIVKDLYHKVHKIFDDNPQTMLLDALMQKDVFYFHHILTSGEVDLEYCYKNHHHKTALHIACSKPEKRLYVYLLIFNGADVNKMNMNHYKAPIHFAVESGDVDIVKELLKNPGVKINLLSGGNNTAIHLAIKHIEDNRDETLKKYGQIVESLLKAGCDVNIPDLQGITPLQSATQRGLKSIIKLVTEYSKSNLDLH